MTTDGEYDVGRGAWRIVMGDDPGFVPRAKWKAAVTPGAYEDLEWSFAELRAAQRAVVERVIEVVLREARTMIDGEKKVARHGDYPEAATGLRLARTLLDDVLSDPKHRFRERVLNALGEPNDG